MDNSKYLALVDLMGKDGADRVRENAAEFLASLDCEFKPEIRHDCQHEYPGLDNCVDWAFVPVLTESPDTEIIALPWECPYCGNVHPGDRLKCWDGVNGCGAPHLGCDEPPSGVLHLPDIRQEQWKQAIMLRERRMAATMDCATYFYPDSSMTVTHPGQTAKEHKQEIRARVRATFQKVIKGALSLC